MAAEVYTWEVTTPAGTAQSAYQTTQLTTPTRQLVQLEMVWPTGSAGLVGAAFAMGGNRVLPNNAGSWIVAPGYRIVWPLQGQPDSGAWEIWTYNTGTQDHTLYITFLMDLPSTVVAPPQASPATSSIPGMSGAVSLGPAPAPGPPPQLILPAAGGSSISVPVITPIGG